MPDLQELARLALGRHHAARAVERVRHFLLAIDVLAGLEAVHRVLRVPEIRGRDDDRVELFFLVEHLAVILVGVHLMLESAETVDDALLVVLRPHVADGAEAEAGDAQHGVGEDLSLRAGAKEGDVDHLEVGGRLRRRGDLRDSGLLVGALSFPRVAEEPERGKRRESLQYVAAVQFPGFPRGRRRLCVLVLVVGSHGSSPFGAKYISRCRSEAGARPRGSTPRVRRYSGRAPRFRRATAACMPSSTHR